MKKFLIYLSSFLILFEASTASQVFTLKILKMETLKSTLGRLLRNEI